MDLKETITQLDSQISNLEESLKTIQEQLKKAKSQRRAFLKLEEKAKDVLK